MRCVATARMTCTRARWAPKCADCHTENDWKEARLDHEKIRFPLEGKHVDTKCVDCHKKGADYKDAPRTCIGYHKKDGDSSKGHKGLYASLLREAARALGGDVPSHLREVDRRWSERAGDESPRSGPHSGFIPDLSQATTLNA